MNVLLVNSFVPRKFRLRDPYFPIGLMYLSASLKKAGHCTKIVDFEILAKKEGKLSNRIIVEKLAEAVENFQPSVVGINAKFSMEFNNALLIVRLLKKMLPGTQIAVGGAHATLFSREILERCREIDFVIVGEGEETFAGFIGCLGKKKGYSGIGGLAFRAGKKIVVNQKNSNTKDLDSLPFPDYDAINLQDYACDTSSWHNPRGLKFDLRASLCSSRGCPNDCGYCLVKKLQGKYRMRSAGNVLAEMKILYFKYGFRYFSFIDDNLTVSKKRAMEIMQGVLDSGMEIEFDIPNGIDVRAIDSELMDCMIKAGWVRTAIGIEVGSEEMRKSALNKNMTNKQITDFLKLALQYKQLKIVSWFMYGFPQETKQTLEETLNFAKAYPFDFVSLEVVVPFYGTKLFEYSRENNLLTISPEKFCDYTNISYRNTYLIRPEAISIQDLKRFKRTAKAELCKAGIKSNL